MTKTAILLTCEEATVEVVQALDEVTVVLRRRRPRPTIKVLLENRVCRSPLEIDEDRALDAYRRTVAMIAASGHYGIISDQIDGYLSALGADPAFVSVSTA